MGEKLRQIEKILAGMMQDCEYECMPSVVQNHLLSELTSLYLHVCQVEHTANRSPLYTRNGESIAR
jgi:hypothetical protein